MRLQVQVQGLLQLLQQQHFRHPKKLTIPRQLRQNTDLMQPMMTMQLQQLRSIQLQPPRMPNMKTKKMMKMKKEFPMLGLQTVKMASKKMKKTKKTKKMLGVQEERMPRLVCFISFII